MDKYDLASNLLEEREINEMAVGEIISSGLITTTLGPLAAGVLSVIYGSTNLSNVLTKFKKKDITEQTPIDRVKVKLSKEIEKDSHFYKVALTKLVKDTSLKLLNDISLEISKHLKLSKEETIALHDYLFTQRNKIREVEALTNH